MALAALIIACEPAQEGHDALRATLPLLGGTLVEHQARQAASLGAEQIVVLVARVPPALVAGLDRLRREGLRVDAARNLADAADRIHPDERVLLLGDGCLAETTVLGALAGSLPPALLVLADRPERAGLERIDAKARWAGAALIASKALRQVAAMLGDWDAQSTLLRAAVQAGATRIDADAFDASPPPRLLLTAGHAAEAERGLLRTSGNGEARWARRYLLGPPARVLAGLLAVRGVRASWLSAGGALLALAAIGPAILGGRLTALALPLVLASGLVSVAASRITALRLSRPKRRDLIELVRALGMTGALAGAAAGVARGGVWGWWVLAALVPGALLAQSAAERAHPARNAIVLADPDALAWLFLAGWIVGGVGGGIAAAAAYAVFSFAWVQASLPSGSDGPSEV